MTWNVEREEEDPEEGGEGEGRKGDASVLTEAESPDSFFISEADNSERKEGERRGRERRWSRSILWKTPHAPSKSFFS